MHTHIPNLPTAVTRHRASPPLAAEYRYGAAGGRPLLPTPLPAGKPKNRSCPSQRRNGYIDEQALDRTARLRLPRVPPEIPTGQDRCKKNDIFAAVPGNPEIHRAVRIGVPLAAMAWAIAHSCGPLASGFRRVARTPSGRVPDRPTSVQGLRAKVLRASTGNCRPYDFSRRREERDSMSSCCADGRHSSAFFSLYLYSDVGPQGCSAESHSPRLRCPHPGPAPGLVDSAHPGC